MQPEQFKPQGYFCRMESDMCLCRRWRNKAPLNICTKV